jgi:hypothetical protein
MLLGAGVILAVAAVAALIAVAIRRHHVSLQPRLP